MVYADELPDFDQLWNFAKPAETEKKFRALLPQGLKSGRKEYILQLQSQIARTLGLQGKFDEAHQLLDAIEEELDESTPTAHVRYLLERGRVLRSGGRLEPSRPAFEKAWERARKAGFDRFAVDAAHMLALVAEKFDDRVAWTKKGMEIAEASEEERAQNWLGPLYNNLGWDYHDRGDYERALAILKKGWTWHQLRVRKSGGDADGSSLTAKYSVAVQLRKLGRPDEALPLLRELVQEWDAIGDGVHGFTHEEIGECLLLREMPGQAHPHFEKAYRALAGIEWLRKSEPERLARLKELAETPPPAPGSAPGGDGGDGGNSGDSGDSGDDEREGRGDADDTTTDVR